jgi:hypothetical protein
VTSLRTLLRCTVGVLCAVWLFGATGASAQQSDAAAKCEKNEELEEGICYPKCQDKFAGEGPLCKQICPERTQDMGNHCLSGPAQFRKKFYERGPGRPVKES